MKKLAFAFFLAVVSQSLSAQDIGEPNNDFNNAHLIGFEVVINALISQSGDDDYYELDIEEPGVIEVEVLQVPGNIDMDLYVYGPGQEINEIGVRDGYLNGESFTYRVSTCQVGAYYLFFEDDDGHANASVQYRFVVRFTPFSEVDECECRDDSFGEACQIPFAQPIEALIAPWFDDDPRDIDQDYFELDVEEPGVIEIDVLQVPGNIDLDLYVYGPGQEINEIGVRNGYLNGEAFTYRVSTCQAGPHYLFFEDDDGQANALVQYRFVVRFTPFSEVDECECRDDSFDGACQIPFAQPIEALIAPWFDDDPRDIDQDYFELDVEEPGVIEIEVLEVPGNIDLDLYVYGPGQEVDEIGVRNGYLNGEAFTYRVSTCRAGPHYLFFEDDDGQANALVQYRFIVRYTPFSEIDRCECNESFNEACQLSTCDTVQAIVGPWYDNDPFDKDEDYYALELSDDDVLHLLINSVPGNIGLCVDIYNSPQGAPIASYNGLNGQAINVNFTPSATGTYYLRVADCGNDFNGNDQYTMYVDVNCDLINALNGPATNNAIRVFPNPFEGYLFIELPETAGQEAEIRISDLAGKALLFRKVANTGQIKIDTKHLPAGLFILTVQAAGKQYSSKLVKM